MRAHTIYMHACARLPAALLETELRGWEEDSRQWPEPLDWALFEQFLIVEHSYLALDLDDEVPMEISEIDDELLLETDED